MTTAYIAGPMTGLPDYNRPAFFEAAKYMQHFGYDVINPAENFGGDTTLAYEKYIELGVSQAESADAVVLLPGWQHSHGAVREAHAALSKGRHLTAYNPEAPFGDRRTAILKLPSIPPAPVAEAPSTFETYLDKMRDIHRAKRADYTGGGDILHNYRTSAKLAGIATGTGMFARLCEKIVRLSVCLPKDGTEVKDETVEDTLLDVSIIALLMLVERESRKAGEGFI